MTRPIIWGPSTHAPGSGPALRALGPGGSRLRLYFEVARRGFRRYATYRAATAAGIFTNTVFGFLRVYALLAVFAHRSTAGGFDARDTVTYAWMTQGLIMTVFTWGWAEVADRVRDGSIATDLLRPMDVQGYWLAHDVGRATYHIVSRGLPPVLVGALVFDLRFPQHAATWLALFVSVYLAVAVAFAWKFLLNLTSFWLLDFRGVSTWGGILANILSGFYVPVGFFPAWAESGARALPFVAMVQTPIDVFLEKPEAAAGMGLQVVWAVVLLLAGRAVLAAGTRKLVIQGG